jgi:uncharacterized protein YuzE
MYKIHDPNFAYPVNPKDYKKINCYRVEYNEEGRIINAVFLKGGKPVMDVYNELSSIEIQYSDNNEKWFYRDVDGKSTVYNVEYESYDYDSTGKLLSCTNYSAEGEIVEDSVGIAKYIYDVDSLNNIISNRRVNLYDDTTMNYRRQYKDVYKYDSRGNLIEVANFDENNDLLLDLNCVAITRFDYNENNEIIDVAYFDVFNERTISKDEKASRIILEYDSNGNCIQMECLDENNNLLFNDENGYSYIQFQYYDNGNVFQATGFMSRYVPTVFTKFRENGEMESKIEYTIIGKYKGFEDEEYDCHRFYYDDKGNVIEIGFYDAGGHYYETSGGFTRIRYKYDKDRNITEQGFYTARGDLTEGRISGIATYKYKYSKGILKEILRFDADGKLISQSTRKSY